MGSPVSSLPPSGIRRLRAPLADPPPIPPAPVQQRARPPHPIPPLLRHPPWLCVRPDLRTHVRSLPPFPSGIREHVCAAGCHSAAVDEEQVDRGEGEGRGPDSPSWRQQHLCAL